MFKRYEYDIGMGYYDTCGLFEPVHFNRSEYFFHLIAAYVLVELSMIYSCVLVIAFVQRLHWWVISEFLFFLIMLCVIATLEPFQKSMNFHKRLKEVPKTIKKNAKIAYGIDWREPAIECHEAHIAGDCLLCGAF